MERVNLQEDQQTEMQGGGSPVHRATVYSCSLCSAKFNRRSNFTRHKMIHSVHPKDENRYDCPDCGKFFLQKCDLKRHQLIHNGKEPHQCQYCDKKYIRKSDLVTHMRFHTKERAFGCDRCEKSFYQSGDLYRHKRRAHACGSLLTCGHCSRKFSSETTLIRHMQSSHRDVILMSLGEKLTQHTRCASQEPPIVVAVPQDVLASATLGPQTEGSAVLCTSNGTSHITCVEGKTEDGQCRADVNNDPACSEVTAAVKVPAAAETIVAAPDTVQMEVELATTVVETDEGSSSDSHK